jgi:hypothetical protein
MRNWEISQGKPSFQERVSRKEVSGSEFLYDSDVYFV